MDGIGYILLGLAALSIWTGLLRWALRINEQVENQEIIIQLLSQQLKQQGLTVEEINRLLNPKRKARDLEKLLKAERDKSNK